MRRATRHVAARGPQPPRCGLVQHRRCSQSPGATLNTPEKLAIARQLSRLGVDVCEAGALSACGRDLLNLLAKVPLRSRGAQMLACDRVW